MKIGSGVSITDGVISVSTDYAPSSGISPSAISVTAVVANDLLNYIPYSGASQNPDLNGQNLNNVGYISTYGINGKVVDFNLFTAIDNVNRQLLAPDGTTVALDWSTGTVAKLSDIPDGSAYAPAAGSTSVVTLGTITAGTWNGATIALANGGTGATTAKGAVTALTTVVDDANTTIALSATTDSGYIKRCTAATAIGITTPSTDPGDGWSMMFIQAGAGQITFTPYSGHTINSYGSLTKTAGQHAAATLVRVASGVYNLSGNLA